MTAHESKRKKELHRLWISALTAESKAVEKASASGGNARLYAEATRLNLAAETAGSAYRETIS